MAEDDYFGYFATPPPRSLRREVIRWLQSLDLTHSVRDPRRDLANGFLVAEVVTRYFPTALDMHSFTNGLSMATRSNNWGQIVKFFLRRGTPLPDDLVEGTMAMHYGAAHQLMDHMYEMLTTKKLPELPQPSETSQPNLQASSSSVEGIPASQVFQFANTRNVELPDMTRKPRQTRSRGQEDLKSQAPQTRRGHRKAEPQDANAMTGAAPISATVNEGIPVQFGTIKLAHLDNVTNLRKAVAQQ